MKCPLCKTAGAHFDKDAIKSLDRFRIGDTVKCKNVQCYAYDPISYGFHEDMTEANKLKYRKYQKIVGEESDFGATTILNKSSNASEEQESSVVQYIFKRLIGPVE